MQQHQQIRNGSAITQVPAAAPLSTEMRASDSRTSDQSIESTSSMSEHDQGAVKQDDAPAATVELPVWKKAASFVFRHSNFYRIHLTCYIIIPLLFGAIFYAIDNTGASFVDSYFVCVSAMTVTGLNPLLMENVSTSQQALTFILLFIGSTTGPALITLLVRRHYFAKRFDKLLQTSPTIRQRIADLEDQATRKASEGIRIRPEMIKRVDEPIPLEQLQAAQKTEFTGASEEAVTEAGQRPDSRLPNDAALPQQGVDKELARMRTIDPPGTIEGRTIGIQEPASTGRELRKAYTTGIANSGTDALRKRNVSTVGEPLARAPARRSSTGHAEPFDRVLSDAAMGTGYGGFPNPVKAIASAVHRRIVEGQTSNGFDRSVTLQSVHSRGGLSNVGGGNTRAVSYISFDAVVSGNSQFHNLSEAQREELGGVEYRAINLLVKIVGAYWILIQFIPVLIVAPIFAAGKYNWIFAEGQGTTTGQAGWYAVFNLCSCYANAGLSLLDESMGLFTESYAYVLVCGFLILAGNTAFPVLLRLVLWTISKLVPTNSRTKESLQFILDHPRRLLYLLYPSHQTWLLVILIILFTSTDWVAFLVLDIGNPVVYGLKPAARAIDSLFQSISVRTAGFSITTLSALAPAVQLLYVIMMYLAIYPIALSVRTTNVYEEQAMGILPSEKEDPNEVEERYNRTRRVGGYFAYHARKQLAFDVWSLGFAVWLICIIERDGIIDGDRPWLNIFSILFEATSAYGTVGLSLGVPYAAFSLVGDMRKLSKLVLIAVMIRGRHRALPNAIDRSIMLPSDIDIQMASRSSTTHSSHSDRSITRDGHVVPNLGKTHTSATGGHADTLQTGQLTAVDTIRSRAHARRLSTNSQAIHFAD